MTEDPKQDQDPTEEELRLAIFEPPSTKEDLHDWIQFYLGIDYPGEVVDPDSNSSPMDMIWEVYSKLRESDPKFSQALYYACRDGYKTLSASTLETVVLAVLGLNAAHMAAILDQSDKAKEYIGDNFSGEYLHDYVDRDAKRRTVMVRPEAFGGGKSSLGIVVATMKGTNYQHVPLMVMDEVDVLDNPKVFAQAKLIPSARRRKDGTVQLPVTVYTSTRKFAYGNVQNEIDRAEITGLHIRHWNIIDVSERCPPGRHKPELPMVDMHYNRALFRSVTSAGYASLTAEEAKDYAPARGYAGCVDCPLFSVCQTRLAHRRENGLLLKPIDHVINLFRNVSPELASAELMCWKPASTGLIYPTLSRLVHKKTAAQIAEMLDGRPRDPRFTRADLILTMKELGLDFYAGVDWGFTHNFVFIILAVDGAGRTFVLDCLAAPGLELDDAVAMSVDRAGLVGGPKAVKAVYADQAYPGHNKTLHRKGGFNVPKFKKVVADGIEAIRMKLMTATGTSSMYFLSGDTGVEFLFGRLAKYHWLLDAAGVPTKDPDKREDDECDGLRYPVQCLFSKTGGIMTARLSEAEKKQGLPQALTPQDGTANWMTHAITVATQNATPIGGAGGSGSVLWDFGEGGGDE